MTRLEHLLFILSEECAEVLQRASKAARFGLDEVQPDQPYNNAERLAEELDDLTAVVEMIAEFKPNIGFRLRDSMDAKKAKVENFLLISRFQGTLSD